MLEFAGMTINLAETDPFVISPTAIFLLGGVLIAAMLFYLIKRRHARSASVKFSDISLVKRSARSSRQKFRVILPILRILAIALMVFAFARPRSGTEYKETTSEGIDIALVLDVSSSMQAEDFKPNNRLYVAKEKIKEFIGRRTNDRIGLVVFARSAYTQCPLTTDYGVLVSFVDHVTFGVVDDGTAIGMAIAAGVNRLRDSDAKSKIIVLLTDGDNNAGEIDPLTAANLAAAFDIKVYTIGVGKPGNAMFPYMDPIFGKRYVYQPTKVDEATLTKISEVTGGSFYRAKSGEELSEIYATIDELEKTEVKTTAHVQYRELFQYFAGAGLLLLVLELLLSHTIFRKLP